MLVGAFCLIIMSTNDPDVPAVPNSLTPKFAVSAKETPSKDNGWLVAEASDISKRYVLPLTMVKSGASTGPDPVSMKYLYVSMGA